jgi:hypothetical protein
MLRAAVAVLALAACVRAQTDVHDRIRMDAFERSGLTPVLVHLCDDIGPRLTGSAGCRAAAHWLRDRLREHRLTTELETWEVPRGWQRGAARARLQKPFERELALAAVGWSPPGAVRAAVVDATAGADALRGRIALAGRDAVPPAGAGLCLLDASKDYGLLATGTVAGAEPFTPLATPTALLRSEDFELLQRLLARGLGVTADVVLETSFTESAVEADNVVAELKGRELEDEIVFALAHFDSWDLGTGATDDAASVAVVVEAARILAGLPERPRRTLRFVLVAGGEQDFAGSRAYVARHRGELPQHKAGLVVEGGTGSVVGVALEGRGEWVEPMERLFGPVRDLGFNDVSVREAQRTDHVVLRQAAVPAFALVRQAFDLHLTADTPADTYDKLVPETLMQAACVLASGLWALADHEGPLPGSGR